MRAGQELVSLDDRVEVATLKSLQAQRRLADINFERDQRLIATKAISRTDFDKTDALLKDVSAQVEKTEAVIARKHLRAPFDGRIGIPQLDPGQYATEGQAIVTLQALDTLEVDFSLPEQELPRLAVGQRVRCRVQAYPEQSFDGHVSAIDAKVDGNTRNVLVRARVPNTASTLLPGMFVSVEVIVGDADGAGHGARDGGQLQPLRGFGVRRGRACARGRGQGACRHAPLRRSWGRAATGASP